MKNKFNITLIIALFAFFSVNAQKVVEDHFIVHGNCEMCKERIEDGLYRLKGVKKVEWNIESKMLHVVYAKKLLNLDEIHQRISELGYATHKVAADSTAYKNLPYCCQVDGACSPR